MKNEGKNYKNSLSLMTNINEIMYMLWYVIPTFNSLCALSIIYTINFIYAHGILEKVVFCWNRERERLYKCILQLNNYYDSVNE